MLGRQFAINFINSWNSVSKPYRYARKFREGVFDPAEIYVSKPYRYARKHCFTSSIFVMI